MAAGSGASGGSLESKLDKKFQTVSNTMDSIQGLSTWCIENKKFHNMIVKYWMKWLRKSDAAHRLNLVYLANDIIQNCKRKNAIVYRTAFAEMLPDAFLMVNNDGNPKVIRSVERILTIWEERNIYTGALIGELKGYLKEEVKEESPPDTPAENKTPSDSKAALQSKIVAEFVPAALVERLSTYKSSVEEVELREKQLAAMRVDVCSSAALRKLKDKAGGKRFSRDFEEGSTKLQDFVRFLEEESKGGSGLLEALGNADIFYEMQYQEVKIVANAYQTFANRVSHLKRKLDALKSTLPDLDESPIPSPSADAPSPTGSESPFRGMMDLSHPDPDLDGSAMDDEAERPAPSPFSSPGGSPPPVFPAVGEDDNRDVEDMELSDDETEGGGIIVEEQVTCPSPPIQVANPVAANGHPPSTATVPPVVPTPPSVAPAPASLPAVDLSRIGALLNSLTSASKTTGPALDSPTSPPPAPTPPAPSASLGNRLSKGAVTPEGLLSALTKVQGQGGGLQGLTSILNKPAHKVPADSQQSKAPPSHPPPSTLTAPPTTTTAAAAVAPPQAMGNPPPSLPSTPPPSAFAERQRAAPRPEVPVPPRGALPAPSAAPRAALAAARAASALVQALHRDMDLAPEPEPAAGAAVAAVASDSLESKIHSFLQGNPGFSAFNLSFGADAVKTAAAAAGSHNLSPGAGTDTRDGTPVRDEGGGTPTQDEVMDNQAALKFASEPPPPPQGTKLSAQAAGDISSPGTYQNNTSRAPGDPPQQPPRMQQHQGEPHNGQGYQPYRAAGQEMALPGAAAPAAHYQAFTKEQGSRLPLLGGGPGAAGGGGGGPPGEGFRDDGHRGWYESTRGRGVVAPGAGEEPPGRYRYRQDPHQEPHSVAAPQGPGPPSEFYNSNLPPVPRLPPPPAGFDEPHAAAAGERRPALAPEMEGAPRPQAGSIISGMVVHDHQHKSVFGLDDPLYDRRDDHYRRPEDLAHPDDPRYQDDLGHYREGPYRPAAPPYGDEGPPFRPPREPYFRPEDPYFREDSPPHGYPRGALSPSEGFPYDFHPHGSPPLSHQRRPPPPPHSEMRHPGPRPPLRPMLHPGHHPRPRGPWHPGPPVPPFHGGPDPWLRGKRPGPRGGGPGGPGGLGFPPKRPFLPPRY
ncbi:unnamed protein product [Arctogadus glacialis]